MPSYEVSAKMTVIAESFEDAITEFGAAVQADFESDQTPFMQNANYKVIEVEEDKVPLHPNPDDDWNWLKKEDLF